MFWRKKKTVQEEQMSIGYEGIRKLVFYYCNQAPIVIRNPARWQIGKSGQADIIVCDDGTEYLMFRNWNAFSRHPKLKTVPPPPPDDV